MADLYDLVLGLPHTNYRGLSELHLLVYAGHCQWTSIATAIGRPLSHLRTASGGEVYAAFYYIEERIPDDAPLESFGLDEAVRFAVRLRSFKNVAVEGRIVFGRRDRLEAAADLDEALAPEARDAAYPFIHFGNIFITPVKGNAALSVAPPAGADFSRLPPLPNDENPYHLTKAAADGRGLGVLDDSWTEVGTGEHVCTIDVDRDTNGAGLVYFANYVAFMDTAERLTLARIPPGGRAVDRRSLRRRRVAYYGNADASDAIRIRVSALESPSAPDRLGLRYSIAREQDGRTICLSEALKFVPAR